MAGFDGLEFALAILIGTLPAEAAMLTRGVGLPDLDHGVIHGHPVAIQYPADQPYSFAFEGAQIRLRSEAEMEERPDSL
jgi:hypothetical protein